jgi:hypothetical protein
VPTPEVAASSALVVGEGYVYDLIGARIKAGQTPYRIARDLTLDRKTVKKYAA